jgi:predicted small lipoprotein YifL
MSARLVRVVALLALVLSLAACGRKGAPQSPPGEPDTFPRVYPSE